MLCRFRVPCLALAQRAAPYTTATRTHTHATAHLPTLSAKEGYQTKVFTERLPELTRKLVEQFDFDATTQKSLQSLIDELDSGTVSINDEENLTRQTEGPDGLHRQWHDFVSAHADKSWSDVSPPIVAEMLYYRSILHRTGFFLKDHPNFLQDPYLSDKTDSLNQAKDYIAALAKYVLPAGTGALSGGAGGRHLATLSDLDLRRMFSTLLRLALWGNRADMSLSPHFSTHEDMQSETVLDVEQSVYAQEQYLLDDDSDGVWRHLIDLRDSGKSVRRIDFVLDNVGFEFLSDLVLAYFLREANLIDEIVLWTKVHPTFISDTTSDDVDHTLRWLIKHEDQNVQVLGAALEKWLRQEHTLKVEEHPFWVAPHLFDDMPRDLLDTFREQSDLVAFKGDANYRRLVLDRKMSHDTEFAHAVSHLRRCLPRRSRLPVLALRTQKAELTCGLPTEKTEAAAAKDKNWLTNGRWGLIQFSLLQGEGNGCDTSSKLEL